MDRSLATLEHEELLVRRGSRSGLYCLIAVHSTVRGPSLGGCRMWPYDDARAAMRDVLRLSRGMTYKNAVADLPLGGGKGVIMLKPGRELTAERRRAALLDFADTIEAVGGRYVTAEDVGISPDDVLVVRERSTHVAGLAHEQGGSGDPSPWTALGVLTAIRVSCERAFGSEELAGRTVGVVGLGHVGSALAGLLHEAGAGLVVSDVNPARRAVAEALGARWVEPDAAMAVECDVLAPCALGGVLHEDSIPALNCRVVAGAANNQLSDDGMADLMSAHGVLWAPDFVANAGGIINISVELEPGGYDEGRARERVLAVGDTLRTIYDDADKIGATPLTAAMELARRRLQVEAAPPLRA